MAVIDDRANDVFVLKRKKDIRVLHLTTGLNIAAGHLSAKVKWQHKITIISRSSPT